MKLLYKLLLLASNGGDMFEKLYGTFFVVFIVVVVVIAIVVIGLILASLTS